MSRGNEIGAGSQRDRSDGPQPWERQPVDTEASWRAFVLYRDLPQGERSFRRVVEILGNKEHYIRHLQTWSPKGQWVKRVQAWDAHLDRLRQKKLEEAHIDDLEEFRNRLIKLQRANLEAAQEIVDMSREVLASAVEYSEVDGQRMITIPLGRVPTFLRAASAIANTAIDGQATALAVEDVLELAGKIDE